MMKLNEFSITFGNVGHLAHCYLYKDSVAILTFLVISLHVTQRKVSAFCAKCNGIMISNGRLQDFGHDETE